jgi:hypothetical protein
MAYFSESDTMSKNIPSRLFNPQNLCFFLLLFLTGCGTVSKMNSDTFHAGPFTMDLPPDLKLVPTTSTDSYTGAFQGPGIYLAFDYGLLANNFEDWPPATEFELVKIDDKDARIGTLHRGFRPGYDFSTQVAFRDTGGKFLTITAACKTKSDCNRAKQIFRSVKFKPSGPQ